MDHEKIVVDPAGARIAVYTAITGGFPNTLRKPTEQKHQNVDFICFSESPVLKQAPWQVEPIQYLHGDPRAESPEQQAPN